MATTSIIVNSTNSGKVLQKTIPNVNPNADNDKLAAWGQMLTGLTDNTYTKTDRVDKANCDTETGKQTPTITLAKTTDTLDNVKAAANTSYGYYFSMTTTGDGIPYAYSSFAARIAPYIHPASNAEVQAGYTHAVYLLSTASQLNLATKAFTVTIVLPETDNYKSVSKTFSVTLSE